MAAVRSTVAIHSVTTWYGQPMQTTPPPSPATSQKYPSRKDQGSPDLPTCASLHGSFVGLSGSSAGGHPLRSPAGAHDARSKHTRIRQAHAGVLCSDGVPMGSAMKKSPRISGRRMGACLSRRDWSTGVNRTHLLSTILVTPHRETAS